MTTPILDFLWACLNIILCVLSLKVFPLVWHVCLIIAQYSGFILTGPVTDLQLTIVRICRYAASIPTSSTISSTSVQSLNVPCPV
ncbi:hypothetical protein BJX96DRAFT_146172 [Aspergillus floccosus]